MNEEMMDLEQSAPESGEEKMLPVSRVNELVAGAKAKGREQHRAELDALKAEIEAMKQTKLPQASMGGMAAPDMDTLYKEMHTRLESDRQRERETLQQEAMEKEAQQVAQQYHQKIGMGKDHFEDFDEVMSDFNPGAFPELVFLATQAENTPQIMYELAKNPQKLATLDYLVKKDPTSAQKMIARLSKSIQSNDEALVNAKDSPAPLDRMKSSTVGTDNGAKTIRDLRKMAHLRG